MTQLRHLNTHVGRQSVRRFLFGTHPMFKEERQLGLRSLDANVVTRRDRRGAPGPVPHRTLPVRARRVIVWSGQSGLGIEISSERRFSDQWSMRYKYFSFSTLTPIQMCGAIKMGAQFVNSAARFRSGLVMVPVCLVHQGEGPAGIYSSGNIIVKQVADES